MEPYVKKASADGNLKFGVSLIFDTMKTFKNELGLSGMVGKK